ncbi:MAG: TrlF family ATPase, partial [Isosphaeraceae bacterium]
MATEEINPFESGSHWRRWNPHIHAPGTLLNDQFAGDWDGYLKAIENATPVVEVLGVTDYLCLDAYKAVKTQKDRGRLPNVKLLFPNVEFRLTIETVKQKGINLHLIFCPDDADHVERIERALRSLTFEYQGNPYRCTLSDFKILGRAHNTKLTDEAVAR